MAPQILEYNDFKGITNYIKSNECKNIALMLGAGISTAAGIPDFRSPGTGKANLARLNLPYPEAVFEINFFRKNPVPFYTLAHELYPGKFRPTLTHAFIRLLSEHSLLSMCFTQNIDTLERRAGVPSDKIIEAHGSFATQRCIKCKTPFDDEKIKDMVVNFAERKAVPRCERKGCKGLVKPDIVFFGESLPESFSRAPSIIRSADLLIVIGTSLTVHPFASLAKICPDSCHRVLINIDQVGDFGSRADDVILLGKCDEIVRDLCKELGWEEELMSLWAETAHSTDGTSATIPPTDATPSGSRTEAKRDNDLEEEVAKLAEKIQKQFDLEGENNNKEILQRKDTPLPIIHDSSLGGPVVPLIQPNSSTAAVAPELDPAPLSVSATNFSGGRSTSQDSSILVNERVNEGAQHQ
ncbi:class I sirtuins SIR2 family protein [Lentinula lateritia]|uniref:Class I sirtuins SIR2 family protein n=1 Tax=Lentinula aff. lateritia TaxID=2804960 RepID=A0ACC1U826_9AGAR|nr:class I sirtuins SIR2 family protein [Lentinula aff. lateritia]KAJ3849689.1 class I sirtuins SIR2 family protein [Lentinula lateritia]